MSFNFDILSLEEREDVKQMFDAQEWEKLKNFLRIKGVLPRGGCPSCISFDVLKDWVTYAISELWK